MTISPGQELTNFPAMIPATKPGAIEVQNSGSLSAAILASGGTVTLNGATPVAVVNARVTANSIIIFTLKDVNAGTVGAAPTIPTITPGTGFTVVGTALDVGIYNYAVLG